MCVISSTFNIYLKNIICDQMAMRSVDMSKRLGNTDQSQPKLNGKLAQIKLYDLIKFIHSNKVQS